MTLEEAIRQLQYLLEDCQERGEVLYEIYMTHYDVEAIETVLKALEDSISKEKVREKIKSIEDVSGLTTYDEAKLNVLYELIGE